MSDQEVTEHAPSNVRLVTDPALLTVLLITSVGMFGAQAVPPTLPSISTALRVSDAQIGWIMSVFSFSSALTIPFVGTLADIYGRRTVTLSSILLFGFAGIATLFVNSFPALLAVRSIQGIAFAGITPLSVALIGDLYTGASGSAAQGYRISAHGISTTVAPAIAAVLAGLSWKYPFLLYGLAFPIFVLGYYFLPESSFEPEENAELTQSLTEDLQVYVTAMKNELKDVDLSTLIFGVTIVYFVKLALQTFIALFAIREVGASIFVAGLLLSVYGLTRTVVAPFSGAITARFPRRVILFGALGVLAASFVVIPFANSVLLLGVLTSLNAVGDAVSVPTLHDNVNQATTDEHRAGVVSVMSLFKMLAVALSPTFFSLVLAVQGFTALFGLAAAVTLGYAVVMFFLLDTR